MLRTAWWTLRQPRYAAMAAGAAVIAMICIAAGTWQVARYGQSVRANDALRANAHAVAVPLTTALVPLVGAGPAPSRTAIRFRTVMAIGRYDLDAQQYVRDQSVEGASGYYVVTPLRTDAGVLLVVRGFVADHGRATPPTVTDPPGGTVSVLARLQNGSTRRDGATELTGHEIEVVNPIEQSQRLNAQVFNGFAVLNRDASGSAGLSYLGDPDLSNPAGGAYEAQHLAYIIQWYAFALLAVMAPFLVARSEVRSAQRRFLGVDPDALEFGLDADPAGGGSGEIVLRGAATVARVDASTRQWTRAAALADRYGRSLGPAASVSGRRVRPGRADDASGPTSATSPHRSDDAYHGAYNDYLWQLAMADGAGPAGPPSGAAPAADESPSQDAHRDADDRTG